MTRDVSAPTGDALVIGFGSTLRSDDAVGPMAAEIVDGWARPGVAAVATHILTPDLAEAIAGSRLVVFVDARADGPDQGVVVRRLGPGEGNRSIYHSADPRQLLTLARDVFGNCPPAWIVTIPAVDFGIGESLSSTAQAGLERAIEELGRLLGPDGAA